jgi:hypothetical protein
MHRAMHIRTFNVYVSTATLHREHLSGYGRVTVHINQTHTKYVHTG